jgi:Flp pilus assembly protein TadG
MVIEGVSMADVIPLIALAVCLAAAVATLGIGALLLRNAMKDASDLAAQLPTRLIKEDSSDAREANRRKAFSETLWLLIIRAVPGGLVLIFGAILLIWAFGKLLGPPLRL